MPCVWSWTLLLIWALLFSGCGNSSSPSGPAVPGGGSSQVTRDSLFADHGLEAAVRAALGRLEGSITQAELSSLKSLDAHGLGIKDLSGIGRLDSLQSLDLADNEVTDLSPLASLVRLEYLDLSRNHIAEVSTLASLTQLKVLVLGQDAVQDLSPLQGLSHLERLELTEGMASSSVTAGLEARGVEVVWAMPGVLPSSGGGDTVPKVGAGPRIAFSMYKVGISKDLDIWVATTDGKEVVDLISSEVDETQPAWSPEGTQLAYAKGTAGSRDIYVLRAGEKSPVCLAQDQGKDEHSPSWSPDGTQIAYVCDGEIYVMQADGSGKANLTQHPADDRDPSWSPDGTRIAFTSTRDAGDRAGQSDVFAMNADGRNVVNLTHHPSKNSAPCYSPDGTRIVFLSNRGRMQSPGAIGTTFSVDIWMMGTEGDGPQNLSTTWHTRERDIRLDGQPSWSPDGKQIICIYGYAIWTCAPDGSDLTMLLDRFSGASHPTWTADAAMDLAGVSQ